VASVAAMCFNESRRFMGYGMPSCCVRRCDPGLSFEEIRFELPNLGALIFLLHDAPGGGTTSLKNDAQGKVLSSVMLRMELDIESIP
jgi:hypothetical protein